jgi:demethylmenaquinone methyltransferase/2-methoxy-6-polyprenyl-1,4-benzoquinol methylase
MSSTLDRAFSSPAAKRAYVRTLFGTIADRYDLITRLLSFGQDQSWKRQLIDRCRLTPSSHVLDLACGTGDLARLAAARGATVVGLDLTPRMLVLARRVSSSGPTATAALRWLAGDMTSLPFGADQFDVVTTGYGLRNVPDLGAAMVEIHRVLRPGGRLCSLDFNRPDSRAVRAVYLGHLEIVGSVLGTILHGDPNTYRYIPASIRRWPGAAGVATQLRAHGFSDVEYLPVFGGLMTIHVAVKPGAGP